jgi:hypothetical protein
MCGPCGALAHIRSHIVAVHIVAVHTYESTYLRSLQSTPIDQEPHVQYAPFLLSDASACLAFFTGIQKCRRYRVPIGLLDV